MVNKQLSVFLIILTMLSFTNAQASADSRIFIMLNVDNTIVDRLEKCDGELIKHLHKNGIATQKLSFDVTSETSPKFIGLYEKIFNKQPIANESDYMKSVDVKKINAHKYLITECLAIRPSSSLLLKELSELEMPVTI